MIEKVKKRGASLSQKGRLTVAKGELHCRIKKFKRSTHAALKGVKNTNTINTFKAWKNERAKNGMVYNMSHVLNALAKN